MGMLDHIILFRDKTFTKVSKQEAGLVFDKWSNNQNEIIEIPRRGNITGFKIEEISDIKSFLENENKRLSEQKKYRCKECLKVLSLSEKCSCYYLSKEPKEYELGGSPQNIVSGLENKMQNQKEIPKEKIFEAVKKIADEFSFAKEWYKSERGKSALVKMAKIFCRAGGFYGRIKNYIKL